MAGRKETIARLREDGRAGDIAPASLDSAAQAQAQADRVHRPVLLEQCVRLAQPALMRPGAIGVDGTLGLAGHSRELLRRIPGFHLVGIDRDGEALALAAKRLEPYKDRVRLVRSAFNDFDTVLDGLGIDRVDMVLLDLGLSSLQIDEKDRGFAYSADAPLDMRMDDRQELTAADLLARLDADRLCRIFSDYGQERYARRIARAIVAEREQSPIVTTAQLSRLVDRVVPRKGRPAGNPAKRVFQALRIAVNGELDQLSGVLPQILGRLNVGGRILVESYHSLEDRIVKSFFTLGTRVTDVPQGLPVLPEQMRPYLADLTHGAVKADQAELEHNPRSASVRLRAVELIRPVPDHAQADLRRWLTAHTQDLDAVRAPASARRARRAQSAGRRH
jgi:16S rRNA (cytosine1402-N4)-methyltransferase